MYASTASRPAPQHVTPIVAAETGTFGDWSLVDLSNRNVGFFFGFPVRMTHGK